MSKSWNVLKREPKLEIKKKVFCEAIHKYESDGYMGQYLLKIETQTEKDLEKVLVSR